MRKKRRLEAHQRALEKLLWNDDYWWLLTADRGGKPLLEELFRQPEVVRGAHRVVSLELRKLTSQVTRLWVLGLQKVLLPAQAITRALDRVGIGYTRGWIDGSAPILILCRGQERGEAVVEALCRHLPSTELEMTDEQPERS